MWSLTVAVRSIERIPSAELIRVVERIPSVARRRW